MVERITDALENRPDLAACETREELRAEAFGWLAHPEDVIALLNGTYGLDEGAEESSSSSRRPRIRVELRAPRSSCMPTSPRRRSTPGWPAASTASWSAWSSSVPCCSSRSWR